MEPLQQHIHGDLCSEVNEMIIHLKIHEFKEIGRPQEEIDKIEKAKKRHPKPTAEQIVDLLTRVRDEMNQCKQPFKRY